MGQGGPVTGGAVGSITINTAQLAQARAAVNAFATGVNTTLTGMTPSINRAQNAVGGLSASIGQLGVSFGVLQLGRFVVEADAVATSFRRQSVAAVHLAGSQGKLTALLEAYDKATGGAIDRATALSDVTNLLAIGFADSADELTRFVTISRGISIATGRSQEKVTEILQLALANTSMLRLNELGLSVEEVTSKIAELQAADSGLTREMAFQIAVMGLAEKKFAALAESAEGAATGAEKAARAFKDVRLAWGQLTGGTVGFAGNAISEWLQQATKDAEFLRTVLVDIGQALGVLPRSWTSSWNPAAAPKRSVNFGNRTTPGPAAENINEEVREVKLDWARGVNDLNAKLHDDIINAEADYGRQRADAIRTYQKGVMREERDFQRGRLRAELEHLDSIADVYKEQARRESKAAADLARTQGQARADADERIADMRGDSAKRLVELEQDYAKDRERAAEDHRDKLLSAAGRLDAIALLEERKRWARESKDAKEAHDEQRDDLQDQLAERIADEEKALAKSNRLQNEAAQRQLEEARANDALRIEDMKADFAKRKAQEDADRADRLADQAQDHADQLAEMGRAHILRLQQIADQARKERVALQEAADAELIRLKAADEATKKRQEAKEKALEDLWDKFHDHIKDTLGGTAGGGVGGGRSTVPGMAVPGAFAAGGLVQRSGWAQVHRGEYVMPAPAMGMSNNPYGAGSRSISIAQGAITVYGAPGQDIEALADVIDERLIRLLESV